MTEESFVILEGNEIKIAFNKGAEILFEGIRERSFDTFNEHSISDGLTLLYAEMVAAYEAEGKESPYTMESFLFKLTSHEAQSAVMEAQKLAKRWKDRHKTEVTMNKEKIYLNLGIIAFQFGACMIHWGLGLMVLGGWLILGAFIEYDKNHQDKEEGES